MPKELEYSWRDIKWTTDYPPNPRFTEIAKQLPAILRFGFWFPNFVWYKKKFCRVKDWIPFDKAETRMVFEMFTNLVLDDGRVLALREVEMPGPKRSS
jgi:hypothetical protein